MLFILYIVILRHIYITLVHLKSLQLNTVWRYCNTADQQLGNSNDYTVFLLSIATGFKHLGRCVKHKYKSKVKYVGPARFSVHYIPGWGRLMMNAAQHPPLKSEHTNG